MISSTLPMGNALPGDCPTERRSSSSAPTAKERDARLVSRFLAGDESAFVEIMRHHHSSMFAIALSVVRNRSDAEEVAQDTFIRAHRGLINFRGDSSLATWLHHVTFNLARNRYWYSFRRRRQDSRSLEAPIGEDGKSTFASLIADESPDPAREASNREFFAAVKASMAKLTASQREILTLRNFLDHSYDEIASQLGISLGTVKSRIARGRCTLKILLQENYPACRPGDPAYDRWFAAYRPGGILTAISA